MEDEPESEAVDQIEFHYIKGSGFRAIHADGAYGSMAPGGMVSLAFYSERPAIPKRTVMRVLEDGRLGEELSRETKGGIVRDVDFNVLMEPRVAQALYFWLGEQLEALYEEELAQVEEE